MADLTANIIFAIIIGFIPALVWLWFWLKEDSEHPEPKRIIAYTFFAGMMATVLALAGEQLVYFFGNKTVLMTLGSGFIFLLIFALIEEVSKYLAARRGLNSAAFNEPIDAIIYLITAGLGFAALENILFIANASIIAGSFAPGFMTGSMRFLGATLLHSATSAIVGIFIGFSFYQKRWKKVINSFIGIILATLLHALFNFYIIKAGDGQIFKIFAALWLIVLIIILLFEKVKRIKKK